MFKVLSIFEPNTSVLKSLPEFNAIWSKIKSIHLYKSSSWYFVLNEKRIQFILATGKCINIAFPIKDIALIDNSMCNGVSLATEFY